MGRGPTLCEIIINILLIKQFRGKCTLVGTPCIAKISTQRYFPARHNSQKVVLIDRSSFQGTGQSFFTESAYCPFLNCTPRHLIQLAIAHTKFSAAFFTLHSCWQWQYKQIQKLYLMAQRTKMWFLSKGKGAMNAPCCCQKLGHGVCCVAGTFSKTSCFSIPSAL